MHNPSSLHFCLEERAWYKRYRRAGLVISMFLSSIPLLFVKERIDDVRQHSQGLIDPRTCPSSENDDSYDHLESEEERNEGLGNGYDVGFLFSKQFSRKNRNILEHSCRINRCWLWHGGPWLSASESLVFLRSANRPSVIIEYN